MTGEPDSFGGRHGFAARVRARLVALFDGKGGHRPPALGDPVLDDGQVRVEIAGGMGPFLGVFSLNGETGARVMAFDGRTLSIPTPEGCPDGARIIVIDSRGRRDEALLAA
jgi:hypothetical protein